MGMLDLIPLVALLAASPSSQNSPDFSEVNHWGPVSMRLPLVATKGPDGQFGGIDQGIVFHLKISHPAPTTAAGMEKASGDAGARLKARSDVKQFRGGSTLQVRLNSATGELLRFNFQMQDGKELVVDELLLPVGTDLYDFTLTADRHDSKAVGWLSQSYASLRANVGAQKDLKLDAFGSDGLLWQSWKSPSMRLSLLMPHTPYVASIPPTEGEVSHREGEYLDTKYDLKLSSIQYKADISDSIATVMQKDLDLYAVSDGKLTKPTDGKSVVVDGAPASTAECSVETSSGIRRLVLLDTIKDRVLYRFTFSAPTTDAEAIRNLDRVIESIRLLPANP
jgi:hypothetical protein